MKTKQRKKVAIPKVKKELPLFGDGNKADIHAAVKEAFDKEAADKETTDKEAADKETEYLDDGMA